MNKTTHELDMSAIRRKLEPRGDKRMDGRKVAKAVQENVAERISMLKAEGIDPRLAVVLVGEDPASQIYVSRKVKACKKVGISSVKTVFPATISQQELNERLMQLNSDPLVDGILLQLPLPGDLDSKEASDLISPSKDVDGFHPLNLGLLMSKESHLEACTPRGVMILLDAYGVNLRGIRACMVGRSVMVGRPMAQMLLRADATVTTCHRYTSDLASIVRQSDLVIAATGVPHLIKGEWIKEGAVVVDVGQTRIEDTVVGDVEYDVAYERAGLITPVPGGVGPMTVAALMANTALSAWWRFDQGLKPKRYRDSSSLTST